MIRDQKSNKHIADGYKKLFRAFKREAVQFFVAKNLDVSHLTLEALPAVQTWTANCKSDRKNRGRGTFCGLWFAVCGLRFSTKNLMLKVSNVEETGKTKLRKSNSFNNKKSFAQQDGRDANTHTIVTQYRRHCQLALEEAKRFPSAESSLWEKKTIYSPSARNVQRKQNAFSRIIKCATFAVWKCELPLVKLKLVCPKCGLIKENVFFLQALMGDIEKSQKKQTKKLLLAHKGQIFFYNAKVLVLIFCWLRRLLWFT